MDHRSLPSPRGSIQGAACELRISAAPPKPAPALACHAGHLRSTLNSAHELVHRIDMALDRLIGTEPTTQDSVKAAESPSCHEREMQAIGNDASELLARLHRIAQRLDSAI